MNTVHTILSGIFCLATVGARAAAGPGFTYAEAAERYAAPAAGFLDQGGTWILVGQAEARTDGPGDYDAAGLLVQEGPKTKVTGHLRISIARNPVSPAPRLFAEVGGLTPLSEFSRYEDRRVPAAGGDGPLTLTYQIVTAGVVTAHRMSCRPLDGGHILCRTDSRRENEYLWRKAVRYQLLRRGTDGEIRTLDCRGPGC